MDGNVRWLTTILHLSGVVGRTSKNGTCNSSVILPKLSPTRLTGERVVLEPLAVEHAVEMVDVLSSPSLYVLIGGQPPFAV